MGAGKETLLVCRRAGLLFWKRQAKNFWGRLAARVRGWGWFAFLLSVLQSQRGDWIGGRKAKEQCGSSTGEAVLWLRMARIQRGARFRAYGR